jgi:hypothetical protein
VVHDRKTILERERILDLSRSRSSEELATPPERHHLVRRTAGAYPCRMTEDQWSRSADPKPMLEHLLGMSRVAISIATSTRSTWRASVDEERLRRYAVGCYQRLRKFLPHPLAQAAVETAERVASGLARGEELERAHAEIRQTVEAFEGRWRAARGKEAILALPVEAALALALQVTRPDAGLAAWYSSSNANWAAAALAHPGSASYSTPFIIAQAAERAAQADLLRSLFGAPGFD